MDTFEATVTSKGQVTLPAKLRSALGLKSGDKLVFRRGDDGEVHLTARSTALADLVGLIRTGPSGVDDDTVARWIDQSRGARWRSRGD